MACGVGRHARSTNRCDRPTAMRVLCVHQGYELYGSDRAFVESVAAIREAWPAAEITAVLPCDGPIVAPLASVATHVAFDPIWVLRRRGLAKLAIICWPRASSPKRVWFTSMKFRPASPPGYCADFWCGPAPR